MLLSFLTAVGAFIVGLTARSMGQRIAHPWIVTLVLLLPALYYGLVYLVQSPTREVLELLFWTIALAGGGVMAEFAFRSK